MMKEIEDQESLHSLPAGQGMQLLYFSSPDCGVCAPVKAKIEELSTGYPELAPVHIDLRRLPQAVGMFGVFTVPAVLLFVEGRETVRFARHFSMGELEEALDRYQALLYRRL